MPNAVVYQPEELPQTLSVEQTNVIILGLGATQGSDAISELLCCVPGLVDVLASGKGYVAYSVFDNEGEINISAMTVLTELTGKTFDFNNEDDILRGPILVIKEM
jgi:hypothetical protein